MSKKQKWFTLYEESAAASNLSIAGGAVKLAALLLMIAAIPCTLALLLAGAVGNLIDRALQGYVVDMFHVLFMEFAVFNVADICVVVGGFAAVIYYLFFYEKLEGKSKDTGVPKEEQA